MVGNASAPRLLLLCPFLLLCLFPPVSSAGSLRRRAQGGGEEHEDETVRNLVGVPSTDDVHAIGDLVLDFPPVPNGGDATRNGFLGYVPDEVVVALTEEAAEELSVGVDLGGGGFNLKEGESLGSGSGPAGETRARPIVNLPGLQSKFRQYGAMTFEREFDNGSHRDGDTVRFGAFDQRRNMRRKLTKRNGEEAHDPCVDCYFKLKIEGGESVGLERLRRLKKDLEADPDVDHVELIPEHFVSRLPNDEYFADFQWPLHGAHGIDADVACDFETGDEEVLVGVLDTGVRYFHLDLGGLHPPWGPENPPDDAGNIFINRREIPGNEIDDDGNGYIDDVVGYDFVHTNCDFCPTEGDCCNPDNDPDDYNSHGTHIAGTIGAITNNGIGIAGIAGGWSGSKGGVKIVPLKVGYHSKRFGGGIVRMDWAAQAMNYLANLIDDGYNVAAINCSWGSTEGGGLAAAVQRLLARDVTIVHAAGNSGKDNPGFLGTVEGVVSVGATDTRARGAPFSNHGSWVDIAAPGVNILSTIRHPTDENKENNYFGFQSGTSMAAPHVAGVAALIESACPGKLSHKDRLEIMKMTSEGHESLNYLGVGIVNAKNSLFYVKTMPECKRSTNTTATPNATTAPITTTTSTSNTMTTPSTTTTSTTEKTEETRI